MVLRKALAFGLVAATAVSAASCGGEMKSAEEGDVLVSVGDSSLMLEDVVRRIPEGLEASDSTALFNSIVDSWIQDLLLTDVAEKNIPNMEKIDRLVEDYRKRLILSEYKRLMKEQDAARVADADIRRYYEANADDMLLETPVVKGIYIKLPSTAQKLESVREWVFSATKESVDKLEKYGLKEAMQYDYFADRWIDWRQISEQIPYRFYDADAFLESTRNFETSYNGSTYFLHIYEYLKSGDVMPYSFASAQIAEMLGQGRKREAEEKLLASIYRQAISDGTLRAIGFDPLRHKKINRTK